MFRVADQFDVHFIAYIADEHGDDVEAVLTKPLLKRWGLDLDTLADTAGWNGGQLAVWAWPPVKDGLSLYRYPDADEHWVSHILCPGCLLEHTDVPDPPIVMIPNATTIFIAGLPDRDAQATMLELSVRAAGNGPPITRRPLVIDNRWKHWHVVPDSANAFADEYQRHFGEA